MRQILPVLLSLSLTAPASLLAYNDYSNYERGPESYSNPTSPNNWAASFNARQRFSYSDVISRPPIQFPKISLDITFQNTFRNFSSFNSSNFNTNLDLNSKVNSFTSHSFYPKPVVQNYNFGTPTKLTGNLNLEISHFPTGNQGFQPSSYIQTRQSSVGITKTFQSQIHRPIEVLAGVLGQLGNAVKAIPGFFAAVGRKIVETASSLWNRVLLGHRSENTATMPDGTRLDGKIKLNRDDRILAISPGTVRTVGQIKTLNSGETALVPVQEPIRINGADYLCGYFTYDGEKFQLDGPGIKLTNQAGPTVQTTVPFKEYVNGDGQGNETTLGYGAISRNDTFKETTTGLSFRNTNGVWSFDGNQTATLKLDGKDIPVTFDDEGRFKETVKTTPPISPPPLTGEGAPKGRERVSFITNVLPHPATSGYEVEKVTPVAEDQAIRTDIPGTKPNQLTTGQTNEWRQMTGARLEVKGLNSTHETVAKVHQEGEQYVFTSGQVATVSVTGPQGQPSEGQKTLYTEAMLGAGTRLTVTGKTQFPNYDATVIVGKVLMGSDGRLDMEKGTISFSHERGMRLTVVMNGRETAIPIKRIDEEKGTFVAMMPDIALAGGEHAKPLRRELAGHIDWEKGQAILTNTAVKGPILKPRDHSGMFETGPEITGNGYVYVKDNAITVRTDRLINLSEYKDIEERRPIWTTTMNDRYVTAVNTFADPANSLVIRGGGLVLATAMVLPKVVEDGVAFTVESVYPAKEFATHGFLAVHAPEAVERVREAGKAVETISEFFIRAEAGASAVATTGALAVREGKPVVREAIKSISEAFERPPAPTQPARSLGAAARSELADPITTEIKLVQRGQTAAETQVALPHPPARAVPQAQGLTPGTNAQISISGNRVSYNPINPGPLPEKVAVTFRSATYEAIKLDQPATLYRVYSDPAKKIGPYWSLTKAESSIKAIVDNALDQSWGNRATDVVTIRVPAGETVYVGPAASQRNLVGGKTQVYIDPVNPSWEIK